MHIWQRLFWREYRESGPFILIGVFLPLLCLTFRKFQDEWVILPLIIDFAIIAVWSIARAKEKPGSGLPLSTPLRLANRYLVPMLGVMLIGVSIGCLTAFRLDPTIQLILIPVIIAACLFIYTLCTILSTVFPLLPAVIIGLFFSAILFDMLSSSDDLFILLFILLGSMFITAVLWEGYHGKRRVLISRIPILVLLGFLVLNYIIIRIDNTNIYFRNIFLPIYIPNIPEVPVYNEFNFHSIDDTLSLDYNNSQEGKVCLLDRRIPQSYFITPEQIVPAGTFLHTIDCLDRHEVLFAAQAPKDASIRIITWDTRTGKIRENFRFTGWQGMMAIPCFACHSPDNRYLMLSVYSKIGLGMDKVDIWLLDMQRKNATLVVPKADRNQFGQDGDPTNTREVIWTPNRLILQLERLNISIDLHTQHVTTLQIGGVQ